MLFTTGFLEAGYRRFIERRLREDFTFTGSPVRINVRVREKRGRGPELGAGRVAARRSTLGLHEQGGAVSTSATTAGPGALPSVAIIGASDRGSRYALILTELALGTVVGIAEPIVERLLDVASSAAVPPEGQFRDWRDMLARPRFADAVVVSTRDDRHHQRLITALQAGYHVLIDKPMVTTDAEALDMVRIAERAGRILAVCHVLRYTAYTKVLRELIDAGAVGDVVSVEHLEPVGWWHHAHSYVRGNWRRARTSRRSC